LTIDFQELKFYGYWNIDQILKEFLQTCCKIQKNTKKHNLKKNAKKHFFLNKM